MKILAVKTHKAFTKHSKPAPTSGPLCMPLPLQATGQLASCLHLSLHRCPPDLFVGCLFPLAGISASSPGGQRLLPLHTPCQKGPWHVDGASYTFTSILCPWWP